MRPQPDEEIVNDEKVAYFLREYIVSRGNNNKRPDGTPLPLGRESTLLYVKEAVSLYEEHVTAKINSYLHSRGPLVRFLLSNLTKKAIHRKRAEYQNCGKNGFKDGYTNEVLVRINDYFLEYVNLASTRNRVCSLMSHVMLLRSKTALVMQLSIRFLMEIKNQDISKCIALDTTITFGKTNKDGKIQYGSEMSHMNELVCSVGALGLCFFFADSTTKVKQPSISMKEAVGVIPFAFQMKSVTNRSRIMSSRKFTSRFSKRLESTLPM